MDIWVFLSVCSSAVQVNENEERKVEAPEEVLKYLTPVILTLESSASSLDSARV